MCICVYIHVYMHREYTNMYVYIHIRVHTYMFIYTEMYQSNLDSLFVPKTFLTFQASLEGWLTLQSPELPLSKLISRPVKYTYFPRGLLELSTGVFRCWAGCTHWEAALLPFPLKSPSLFSR